MVGVSPAPTQKASVLRVHTCVHVCMREGGCLQVDGMRSYYMIHPAEPGHPAVLSLQLSSFICDCVCVCVCVIFFPHDVNSNQLSETWNGWIAF